MIKVKKIGSQEISAIRHTHIKKKYVLVCARVRNSCCIFLRSFIHINTTQAHI